MNNESLEEPGMFDAIFGFIGSHLWLLLVVFLIHKTIRIVPQGHQYGVYTFGKLTRVLSPGLNFVIPFIQTTKKVKTMEQWIPISGDKSESVITKDKVPVINANGRVAFEVLDVFNALGQIDDVQSALQTLAQSTLRTEIGSMTLEQVLTGRTTLGLGVLKELQNAQARWGIKVIAVEVLQLDLPEKVNRSLEEVISAQNDATAAKTRAEGQSNAIKALDEALTAHPASAQFQLAIRQLETVAAVAGGEGSSTFFLPTDVTSALSGNMAATLAAMQPTTDKLGAVAASLDEVVAGVTEVATAVGEVVAKSTETDEDEGDTK